MSRASEAIRRVALRFGRTPELNEVEFYDDVATSGAREEQLARAVMQAAALGTSFAEPVEAWLDNYYDSVAQSEVYEHLRPLVAGGRVLQLGGTGKEAIKALVGGAAHACLVTPVAGEAALAVRVATRFNVEDRLSARVGFAEDLPLDDCSVDVVISEGCLHHTDVSAALREVHRVLRPGGRFGAFDPWHARLYDFGTAVFGKREPGIECRPLNPYRLAELSSRFPESEVRLHGAIVRYPLIALGKLGYWPAREIVRRWTERDDKFSARYSALRNNGSCVALLATRSDAVRDVA